MEELLRADSDASDVASVLSDSDRPLSFLERMWPRVYGDGDFWGEDMILMNSSLRDDAVGRALTHLEVITLEVGDLIELLPRFPQVHYALCRARTKMAIAKAMRKISWHLSLVRADAEREKTFLALDDAEVQGLISCILRSDAGGGPAWDRSPTVIDGPGLLPQTKHQFTRSLEGSLPAPKQHSHVLGQLDVLQGKVDQLTEAQAGLTQKLDHVLTALASASSSKHNGSTGKSPRRLF